MRSMTSPPSTPESKILPLTAVPEVHVAGLWSMITNMQATNMIRVCSSRLASKIRLTKEFNNLSVALGRLQPWRTL